MYGWVVAGGEAGCSKADGRVCAALMQRLTTGPEEDHDFNEHSASVGRSGNKRGRTYAARLRLASDDGGRVDVGLASGFADMPISGFDGMAWI